jgi:hypothetical protein
MVKMRYSVRFDLGKKIGTVHRTTGIIEPAIAQITHRTARSSFANHSLPPSGYNSVAESLVGFRGLFSFW